MAELKFHIKPSPETNDHEVRVYIDGRDVLGNDYLGVDPPEFFAQFSNPASNRMLIGRCTCGVVGCCDEVVLVERNANDVTWRGRENHCFVRAHYEEAIESVSNDYSWEDKFRRAERLANDVLRGCEIKNGFLFQWTSARITSRVIKASFGKADQQKMYEFAWDEANDESATRGTEYLKKQLVDEL